MRGIRLVRNEFCGQPALKRAESADAAVINRPRVLSETSLMPRKDYSNNRVGSNELTAKRILKAQVL